MNITPRPKRSIKKVTNHVIAFGFVVVCCCWTTVVNGQVAAGSGIVSQDFSKVLTALQRGDTSSPRATLQSFIRLNNLLFSEIGDGGYFKRDSVIHRPLARAIIDTLDVSKIPAFAVEERAGEVAICLKEVIDRIEIPDWDEIPDSETIKQAEPGEYDRWQIPGTRITINKIAEGPRKHEYLFSTGTVDRAPQYFEDVRYLSYRSTGPPVSEGYYDWYFSAPGHPSVVAVVSWLPEWTKRKTLFGVVIWKWVGVFVGLIIAVAIFILVWILQRYFVRRTQRGSVTGYFLTLVIPLASILIPLTYRDFVSDYVVVRGNVLYIISFAANIAAILAGMMSAFALTNRVAEIVIALPHMRREGLDAQLIRIIFRLLAFALAVIIFLVGGQYLGIPLTTLLASAGVGGLAVALAAQDTLKTIFGTLMLMADKPFRSGDRIVFGKYDGIVEEIGLRSTRVRLLTGHQATIPNDELARCDIENIGRRPHIRRLADIHLPLETPKEKVQQAVDIIRKELENHEGMDPARPPRVYFNEFNSDSFNIRMMYWYSPPDYWKFMSFGEKLNMKIYEGFDNAGIKFLLPLKIRQSDSSSYDPTPED